MNGGQTGFVLNVDISGELFWVKSYPSMLMHMCCMMHVLANVGQVVKNLFPDFVCLSIAVQVACRSMTVNGEEDRD